MKIIFQSKWFDIDAGWEWSRFLIGFDWDFTDLYWDFSAHIGPLKISFSEPLEDDH